MSKKQESLRAELQKVLSRGGRTVISKSSDGKSVPVPEEAEVFEFDFTKEGETYGKVFVSIDGLHQLVIYFDDDVSNSPKNGSTDSESWEQLVKTLKRFAMMKQLSFKLANIDNLENDMAKREHTKRQEKVYEGYHAQGKKASYSDNVPTTKIIIKHKREMQEGEQRFRQIDKIFIENTIGERMLAPTDKPGLARVFARHIAEGGKANDERWNHITGLCEEYQKMAGFVRATRNSQFNESAQKLVTEGINHYQKLRECLGKMSGKRGYDTYFESYTPALMEDEESVDLSEMFMSSSLDPRIESVMPILSKLSKNITETSEMAETIALEEWADDIIGESPKEKSKPSKQEVAKKMHSILSKGKEGVEEGSEQIDELSPGTLNSYVNKARAQVRASPGANPNNSHLPTDPKIANRARGAVKADNRLNGFGPVKKSTQGVVEGLGASKTHLAMAYLKAVVMAPTGTPDNERIRNWQEELADEFDIEMDTAVLAQMLPQFDTQLQAGKFDKLQNRMASRGELYIESSEQGVAEDLDPEQKSAGQFSPKDDYAKPGSLVGANESIDPLVRLKNLLGK